MNNNTRNIVKVTALSVALAACVTMSTVCVISTLNYQNQHDSNTSQPTQQDVQGDQHSDTDIVPSADLNQCADAAATNCVHLPDDQSHAYYVNVGGHQWVYDGNTPAPNAGEHLGGGWYQAFNPYQAVNATGDSIALGAKFSADMGDGLPPCATEDSNNCYWDAATMGNGEGRSFVTIDGVTKYTN